MKIRQGFVSNSSSSSFLIYGTIPTEKQIDMAFEAYFPNEVEDYDDEDDYYEKINKLLSIDEFCDLSMDHPYDDDEFYIGKSWSRVKDDETGKEFKDNVSAKLKKLFGDECECGTYEASWCS
jgi:hypothetical protein